MIRHNNLTLAPENRRGPERKPDRLPSLSFSRVEHVRLRAGGVVEKSGCQPSYLCRYKICPPGKCPISLPKIQVDTCSFQRWDMIVPGRVDINQ